jgi:hypothetical protein
VFFRKNPRGAPRRDAYATKSSQALRMTSTCVLVVGVFQGRGSGVDVLLKTPSLTLPRSTGGGNKSGPRSLFLSPNK